MIRTLLASTALIAASGSALAQTSESEPTLSLSADAQVQVEPDYAQVSSGVVSRAATAREALAENAETMQRVFTALRSAGVERNDMQTSQLSVTPVYSEYRADQPYQREIIGYEARNTVTARIDDTDRLGRMIDAMVEAGANNVNNVSFGAEDTDAAMDQARREAIANLMERAALFADAGGFELCGIRRMSEGGNYQPVVMRMERSFAADAVSSPVAAGELTLTASVSADFCISQD